MSELLREFIETVLENREEDFWKIEAANKSYSSILSYLAGLGKNVKNFESVFKKQKGYLASLDLEANLNGPEHAKMLLFFLDRERSGTPTATHGFIVPYVQVNVKPTDRGSIERLEVTLFFNAPPEAKVNARTYNKWFAENIESILATPKTRSFYVHEFIHGLDMKRLTNSYMLHRAVTTPADKPAYANDPLELNAFFSQAMSDVEMALSQAKTRHDKLNIIRSTPHRFAERFMSKYLARIVRKNLTPENYQRLMKRAATSWEPLRKKWYEKTRANPVNPRDR